MSNQTAPQQGENQQPNQQVHQSAKEITDIVLTRVKTMQDEQQLILPKGYAVGNALKAAYLQLLEVKNKDNQYALQFCTSESISYALLDMVTQGLNPAKKQCYFIMYGRNLQMMRSYMGTIAIAKRSANVKEVFANVIYEKDVFKYDMDFKTGKKHVTEHQQDFDNINEAKVKGAYAVVIYNDESIYTELMTIQQIRAAWEQSKAGIGKAHNKFTSEMAKKTVISRALKISINSSDDGYLYEDVNQEAIDVTAEDVHAEIIENANKGEIGFDPEDIKDLEPPTEQKEQPAKESEPATKETVSEDPDWN